MKQEVIRIVKCYRKVKEQKKKLRKTIGLIFFKLDLGNLCLWLSICDLWMIGKISSTNSVEFIASPQLFGALYIFQNKAVRFVVFNMLY